jgi:hypothetical protein
LIRAAVVGGILIMLGLMCMYYAATVNLMFYKLHMNDFGKFYYSAQNFIAGKDMYGPSPATAIPVGPDDTRQFWNMNPPHFHLLVLPLALLPPAPALITWALLNAAALAASVLVITRELALRWTVGGALMAVLALLVCSATGSIVVTGQLTFLLMLPVTIAWAQARHGRWNRAAVLLGVVISLKPLFGLFALYLLIVKRFTAFAGLAAAAAACFVAGLFVFGVDAHVSWLRAISAVAWTWSPMNASITGLFARAFGPSPFYSPVIDAPALVAAPATAASLVVGALTLGSLATDRSSSSVDRVFGGLLITSVLVSPLGWIYYLWLAAAPATALWLSRARRPSRWRKRFLLLSLPGLLCPLPLLVVPGTHFPGITFGSLYGWSVVVLWLAFVADWLARERAT